jgi:uncharacterized membrane protein
MMWLCGWLLRRCVLMTATAIIMVHGMVAQRLYSFIAVLLLLFLVA